MTLPHDTVVDLLDGLDFFASLSDEEIECARQQGRRRSPGTPARIVFAEGDAGDSCYVIHSGQREADAPAGRRPADHARAGRATAAIVGELALFASDRRSATMQAIEQTTAVAISREDLMAILHGNAEAAISMAVHVAELLQQGRGPPVRQRRRRPSTGASWRRCSRRSRRARRATRGKRTSSWSAARRDLARLAGAPKDAATRVLHWLENEGVDQPQAGPDRRPFAGCAQGAPRLSRRRAAAGAVPAADAVRAGGCRARPGAPRPSRSTRTSPARARRWCSGSTAPRCRRTARLRLDHAACRAGRARRGAVEQLCSRAQARAAPARRRAGSASAATSSTVHGLPGAGRRRPS